MAVSRRTLVFEAVVNAVAHRDYSIHGSKIRLRLFDDRLELYSPGRIRNAMTVEGLAHLQSARNEVLTTRGRGRARVDDVWSGRRVMAETDPDKGVPDDGLAQDRKRCGGDDTRIADLTHLREVIA